MKKFPIGKTTVTLDLHTWDRGFLICILCTDSPFTDYDAIRSRQSVIEINEALDWIIENENQPNMKGYTHEQVVELKKEIDAIIDKHT